MTSTPTAKNALDGTITAEQLADVLNVNVRVVHKMAREGNGPASVFVGDRRRFPISAVNAWLRGEA